MANTPSIFLQKRRTLVRFIVFAFTMTMVRWIFSSSNNPYEKLGDASTTVVKQGHKESKRAKNQRPGDGASLPVIKLDDDDDDDGDDDATESTVFVVDVAEQHNKTDRNFVDNKHKDAADDANKDKEENKKVELNIDNRIVNDISTNESSSKNSNHNNDNSHNHRNTQQKWLLYFTESGFSNQLICLEHAYYIARKCGIGIILPPILPHYGKGSTSPRNVFGVDAGRFKTRINVHELYLWQNLPRSKYIPMHHVLDINYSLPVVTEIADNNENNTSSQAATAINTPIPTMDVKEFLAAHGDTINASSFSSFTWVLEMEYTHFNTKWMYGRDDLVGQKEIMNRTEYGTPRVLNMTYRDVAMTLLSNDENASTTIANGETEGQYNHQNSYGDATILIFMDTFYTKFDPASMMQPAFRPRFSEPIRTAARRVQDGWNVEDYAAVHIRGSDGPFQNPERFNATIITTMGTISSRLQNWIIMKHYTTSSATTTTTTATSASSAAVVVVGLFVATDVGEEVLKAHAGFQETTRVLIDTIQQQHGVTVRLLWGQPFEANDQLKEYVRYAELFMDQQLAACANIGFAGTPGSSFSKLIETLRHDEAC